MKFCPRPFDGCSHCYFHDLDNLRSIAKDAEDLLSEYGYEDAESILNEWNVGGKVMLERFQEFGPHGEKFRAVYDQRGSSMAAATFAILQTETDVRIGCYFEADVVKEWCGLYRVKDMSIGKVKATVAPTNVFYAFKSFNELYKLGNEVAVRLTDPALNGVAAVSEDGRKWGLLLSNYSREPRNIKLSLQHIARAKATLRKGNDAHLFEIMSTGVPKSIELEPYTFVFLGNVLS